MKVNAYAPELTMWTPAHWGITSLPPRAYFDRVAELVVGIWLQVHLGTAA